jgi:hypothetical protein
MKNLRFFYPSAGEIVESIAKKNKSKTIPSRTYL